MERTSDYTGASWVFGSVLHESAKRGYCVESILNKVDDTNIVSMCKDDKSVSDILDYIIKRNPEVTSASRKYSLRVSKLAGQFYFFMHTLHGISVSDLEKYATFSVFEKNFTTIKVFDYSDIWEEMLGKNNSIVLIDNENLEEIIKSETAPDYEEEMFE